MTGILEDMKDLLEKNIEDALEILTEDEGAKKIRLGMSAEIDLSESSPQVKTRLSFSQVHTDERIRKMMDAGDPNQLGLNLSTNGHANGAELPGARFEREIAENADKADPEAESEGDGDGAPAKKKAGRPKKKK